MLNDLCEAKKNVEYDRYNISEEGVKQCKNQLADEFKNYFSKDNQNRKITF